MGDTEYSTHTTRGLAFATATKEILERIEARIAEHVGDRRYAQVRATIESIPSLFPSIDDDATD